MKNIALATLLSSFLCVPCAASPTVDDTLSELPSPLKKGTCLCRRKIKRNVPVEVVLATGAEHSVIDGGFLDKYKLPAYYSAEPPITGRNDRLYSFSTVPDIRVADAKETSLNMRLGSLSDVSKRVGREVFGILGADFFKGRVVQFDFGKKVVRFLPQSPTDALTNKTGAEVTRRVLLAMSFYKEDQASPIVENVTFDGKKIKTLLDTGAVTVVSLSSSAAKQLALSPPAEKGDPRPHKVSSLRFNDYELTNVPVILYPKGSSFDRDQRRFGAVAGSILLQNFVVTFDFRKRVVILEHI